MGISDLGNFIDGLSNNASAVVVESLINVSVSNLHLEDTVRITQICDEVGWPYSLFDEADQPCATVALHADFAPFRAVIVKPTLTPEILSVLTLTGMKQFLESQPSYVKWYVAGLGERIVTRSTLLCPWYDEYHFDPMPATKNPRSLVREYTSKRIVPPNISPWLLVNPDTHFTASAAFSTWLNASVRAVCRSLANEIDTETGALKCNGTPKLSIPIPDATEDVSLSFSLENFKQLQIAAAWVFENEREAESRHTLLATEVARSGHPGTNLLQCFGEQISSSLSSAKIAYQMMLSDVSKDTLKALGDLRKAVTEETAKMTDITRQLIGGVTAAMAVGFGLIATRISTNTNAWLIVAVMLLVVVYVSVIIYSGTQFISIQRQLRADWQSKLYRFLPGTEYEKMVSVPTGRSEHTFFISAWLSGAAIIVLTGIVLWLSVNDDILPRKNITTNVHASVSIAISSTSFSSVRSQAKMSSSATSVISSPIKAVEKGSIPSSQSRNPSM